MAGQEAPETILVNQAKDEAACAEAAAVYIVSRVIFWIYLQMIGFWAGARMRKREELRIILKYSKHFQIFVGLRNQNNTGKTGGIHFPTAKLSGQLSPLGDACLYARRQ